MARTPLVLERIGQFFMGEDRLEYTEFGSGDRWVILIHGQLMVRRMCQPLARALAAEGNHVITLDLLGHGRSDRPDDPMVYSIPAFGQQVLALLDHLGVDTAIVGGTSLGANVALEVADVAPQRVQGLLVEMPVLDNAVEAAVVAYGPMMLAARHLPLSVRAVRAVTRPVPRGLVPFWAGIGLDICDQRPGSMAAILHGIVFGRLAPPSSRRRALDVPTMVVGHRSDPIHPAADAAMLAAEVPGAQFVQARSILEWRLRPERLDGLAADFVAQCWQTRSGSAANRA
ncbi:MAG TPA: alpha/beta fold hydrolase [Nocardioides sp.]